MWKAGLYGDFSPSLRRVFGYQPGPRNGSGTMFFLNFLIFFFSQRSGTKSGVDRALPIAFRF